MTATNETEAGAGRLLKKIARGAKARRLSPQDRERVDAIEAARGYLETDPTPVVMQRGPTTVGEMAKRASVSKTKALLLHSAISVWRPGRVLEMGTCCGVSGAYIQAALPIGATLVSLEGNPTLADAARGLWKRLGYAGEVVVGRFDDTLGSALDPAPDVAFVDGDHHEEPTWAFFEQLTGVCATNSLLLFDDIEWSDEMRRVWRRIRADRRAVASTDVDGVGLLVTGP